MEILANGLKPKGNLGLMEDNMANMARNAETGKEHQTTTGPKEEARKLIGQAIIDGLLVPPGVIAIPLDYAQGDGDYHQTSGIHWQNSGGYWQGPSVS